MSAINIYKQLRHYGLNHAGACAMMGNLMAESSLISNIAQRGMTNLSDDEYTAKFNSAPDSCYRDGVGYGLAQWTYWSRKKNLFEFAYTHGISVGDEEIQIDFLVHELKTEYSGLYKYLCSTTDMYEATSRICKEYERPAVNNIDTRYNFAQIIDRDFAEESQPGYTQQSDVKRVDQSILILQAVLVANGYNVEITGHKSAPFFAALREFVKDIGG